MFVCFQTEGLEGLANSSRFSRSVIKITEKAIAVLVPMATPCVCISFKQFFLELYHSTTDNFRPGDGCHFQQNGGQHSDLVALTVQTSYK